jgi:hypothetical protein
MNPDPVVIGSATGGSLSFSLVSGDSDTNLFLFSVTSDPIVFDVLSLEFDTQVFDAGVVDDPDGIIMAGFFSNSAVTGFVVDFHTESTATFYVQTESTPTSMSVWQGYMDPQLVASASFTLGSTSFQEHLGDSASVMPEPTAALVFAAGLVIVGSATRRRGSA